MYRETTFLADEFGLGLSVGLGDMAAPIARPAGVPGVYEKDRDTGELALVGDEPSEFVEGPFAEPFALLFSNRCPETLKVFKDNTSPGVFSSLNDFLGNSVVGGALESSLLAGELLEVPPGGRRSLLLEGLLEGVDSDTGVIDGLPGERLAVRSGGEVDDAEVHTEKVLNIRNIVFGHLDRLKQIPLAIFGDKVRFTFHVRKQLVIVTDEGNLQASVYGPERGNPLVNAVRKNAHIVSNRTEKAKHALSFLVQLVRVSNLRDATHHGLGRELRRFSDSVINALVKPELVKNLVCPGIFGHLITSPIAFLDRGKQGLRLGVVW